MFLIPGSAPWTRGPKGALRKPNSWNCLDLLFQMASLITQDQRCPSLPIYALPVWALAPWL